MTLTLNTAKQPFYKALEHMHCQTKLVPTDINSPEHILEIVKISLYEPKLGYCDLDFEDSKIQTRKGSNERLFIFTRTHYAHFRGNPLLKTATNFSHSLAYHHTGFAYKRFSDSQLDIPSKLTFIEIFNLGCDINLEHSNQIFLLD